MYRKLGVSGCSNPLRVHPWRLTLPGSSRVARAAGRWCRELRWAPASTYLPLNTNTNTRLPAHALPIPACCSFTSSLRLHARTGDTALARSLLRAAKEVPWLSATYHVLAPAEEGDPGLMLTQPEANKLCRSLGVSDRGLLAGWGCACVCVRACARRVHEGRGA